MNCQQVDKLLYLFCDGLLQPQLRQQIEDHLQECPACRNNLTMTEMENEALRYTEDIPPLALGFSLEVIQKINSVPITNHHSKVGLWSRLMELFRLHRLPVIASVTAAFLLFFVLATSNLLPLPGSTATEQSAHDRTGEPNEVLVAGINQSSPEKEMSVIADVGIADKEDSDIEHSQPTVESNNKPASDPIPQEEVPTPQVEYAYNHTETVKSQTDYSVNNSITAAPNYRGTDINGELRPDLTSREPFIPRPGYMPTGYSLTRIENEADNITTLTYEGDGNRIFLRIIPEGGEKPPATISMLSPSGCQSDTMEAPESAKNESSPQPESELLKTKAVPEQSTRKGLPGEITISWKVKQHNQVYTIQVTGILPPTELGRIAASFDD